jgi:obg-like ATPase 1
MLLWGRVKNGLKMGIVGMPNVGKSSTFNLLTKLNVPAENYPFCTIDPNEAKVAVPDERFEWLCSSYKPKSKIAAVLSIVDIAGLVSGAASGEGLGNAFLSHISGTDGIFHVVRAFEDDEIVHTEMSVDPVRDMKIISDELCLKDLEQAGKRIEELKKLISRKIVENDKIELALLEKCRAHLEERRWIRSQEWTNKEIECLNSYLFLTSKPVIYLVNLN